MEGDNFVLLRGTISSGSFKLVGQFNTPLFKGKVVIPTNNGGKQFIKISAWNTMATALNDIDPKALVKIHGHIEESSYDGKCKHCSGLDKKYWTEVVVDNFTIEGV